MGEVWAPGIVGVTGKSSWKGRQPAEAVLALFSGTAVRS